MTELEHAIKHIKTRADAWAVKEVEKALSQEPCDDCISRQAALNSLIDNTHLDGYDLAEALDAIENKEKLPPVTQKPETGHWFVDERPESDREIICSNCEQPIFKYHKMDFDYRPKYCPNCGAKMQESEV